MAAVSLQERVKLVQQKSGMTAAEFAQAIESNRTSLFNYFSGKQPTLYEVVNIPRVIENISADWLFTGVGNMYKTEGVPLLPKAKPQNIDYKKMLEDELITFVQEPIELHLVEPTTLDKDTDLKQVVIEQQKTINLLLVKLGECRGQLQLYKEFVKQVNGERSSKHSQTTDKTR